MSPTEENLTSWAQFQPTVLTDGPRYRVTRRYLCGTAAAAIGALLAACGPFQQSAPGGSGTGTQFTGPRTLRFTNVWGGAREPLMAKQIEDFKRLQPSITIQNELITQTGMYDKYLAEIAAGTPADVVMLSASEVPRFGKATALKALDDLLKRDRLSVTQIFYETEAKLGQWQARQLGLPQTVAGGNFFLFYNRQHFQAAGLPDRAPATWTEVLESARRLTKREGDTFQQVGALFPLAPFQQMHVVNGGSLFSAEGKKVAFNSAEGLQAVQWQLDAAESLYGGNARVAPFRTELNPLLQGARLRKLSQYFDGVWMFFQIPQEGPDVQFGAGLFPSNRDKNPKSKQTTLADGQFCWLYCMPQGAKAIDAGWLWLRYITEGEGNKEFFFAQGRPSPVRRWTEGQDYQRVNPHWQTAVQALKAATLVPPPPGYAKIQAAWSKMTNEVMDRKAGVREALEAAARDAQQILDEEWSR